MNKHKTHSEEEIKKANIRLHETIANEYDNRKAIFHPAVQKNISKLADTFLVSKTGKALDFGCGTGNMGFLLSKMGFSVSGFDITKQMIAVASIKVPEASFIVADVFAPPFLPESFRVIAISGVLHHVADYKTVIHNAVSLLEPGGTLLILNEPNAGGYRFFKPIRKITSRLLPEKRVRDQKKLGHLNHEDEKLAEYHLNYSDGIDPYELIDILKGANCEIRKLQYTNLNMIGNMGDRTGIDFFKIAPWAAKIPGTSLSPDFNLIAVKQI